MSDFVLSAALELRDRMTGRIKSAAKGLESVRSMAGSASSSIDRASGSMDKAGLAAGKLQQKMSMLRGNYDIRVNARDEATPKISKVRQELSSLTSKAYTATVNIRQNGAAAVTKTLGGFVNAASNLAMGAGVQMVGVAGLGYGVADTIKTYRDFEYQMASVKAITGANADEMARLTQRAKELGETTMFKASEVGKAEEYMGFAGWKTEQIESGLKPVLDLAAAAGEDLKGVADIVTDAMTGFGLRATDEIRTVDGKLVNATEHFTDIMAALATNANTTVGMAGESAKYAAAVVGSLYSSQSVQDKMNAVSDWAVVEGLMANAGIKGSMAGTAQRAMLTRLASLQQNANAARTALGIDFVYQESGVDATGMYHEKGQTRRMRDIIGDIRAKYSEGMGAEDIMAAAEVFEGKKFSKQQKAKIAAMIENVQANGGIMTDQDKATMTTMLSGQEGLAAWLSVLLAKEEDADALTKAIDKAHGKAAEMAKIKNDTLKGDLDAISAAWEAFQLELMQGKGGEGIRSFVKAATEDIRAFKKALEDGFDVGDVASLTGKIISQLKDKFLQLDGIGSILAGGALALGLGKIITLSARAYDAAKQIANTRFSKTGASVAVPSDIASSAGSMVVHAGSVVVNAKAMGGGGALPQGGKNTGSVILDRNGKPLPPSTTTPQPPAPASAGRGAMFKTMGAGALIGAVFAAADVYSAKADRDRIKAEEEYGVAVAQAAVKEANDHLWNVNQDANATNEERSAAFEAFKAAKLELKAMEEHQKASEKDSQEIMGKSIGGAAGAIIGTAVGSLGGPIGMAAGGIIGQVIGEKLAPGLMDAAERLTTKDVDFIKSHSADTADSYDKAVLSPEEPDAYGYDVLAAGDSYDAGIEDSIAQFQRQREQVEMSKQSVADLMHGFRELDTASSESSQGVAAASTEMVSSLQENVPPAVETLSSVTDELESIDMDAETAGLSIGQSMGQAAADTQSAWEPIPPFFMESIYAPISDNASVCGGSAAEGINSGIPLIRSAWDEITSWLAEKFAWISSKASAIAAKASSVFSGSGDVEGNAIGTSYFKGGWTEINEHGGEIIDLPQGSRIYPHATTVEMLKDAFSGYEAEERAMPLPSVQETPTPMVAIDMVRSGLAGHAAEMTALPEFPNVLPQPAVTELTENSFVDNGMPEEMILPSFPALPPFPDLPSFPDLPQFPAIQELSEAPDTQIVPAAVEFVEKKSTDKPMESSEPQVSDLGAMLARMAEKLNLAAKETGGKKDGLIAPSISISGNEFVVREDADIDRIAHELLRLIRQSAGNYQYVGV